MAERNRVLPSGAIVATTQRGTWMGNRGCLHEGHEIVRPWRLRAWLVCRLEFRDRRVAQWSPRRYTPLFFFDEAVAYAAGHRPCGECRHADYLAYRDAAGFDHVADLDRRLHAERQAGPSRVEWRGLPDGAFVLLPNGPALVRGDMIIDWDDATYSYGAAHRRPRGGHIDVLTPPISLDVLRAGVPVQIGGQPS